MVNAFLRHSKDQQSTIKITDDINVSVQCIKKFLDAGVGKMNPIIGEISTEW